MTINTWLKAALNKLCSATTSGFRLGKGRQVNLNKQIPSCAHTHTYCSFYARPCFHHSICLGAFFQLPEMRLFYVHRPPMCFGTHMTLEQKKKVISPPTIVANSNFWSSPKHAFVPIRCVFVSFSCI